MGGGLRQVHVSVFAKRIGVHGARVQHRGRSKCAIAKAGAKDVWIEVQSPNFKVISDASEKEARKIADPFEQDAIGQ
jgi:hypothetical protein